MTVSTAYSVLSYAGNGATTAFAVTWPFLTGTLVVTLVSSTGVETVKSLTTHYTVSGGTDSNGLPATGTVTMLTAPASGETLRITRSTTKTQASTWTESDPFPQKTVEAALDKLTLLAQEAGSPGTVNDGIGGDVMELVSSGATDYWDAESQIIRNVADATASTDAVNYAQLQAAAIALGTGDVVGPASSTDDALARYDGATGKLLASSPVTMSDAGVLAPTNTDGGTLGSVAKMWSDLFLALGGVVNFDSGDVTITHSANALTFQGASNGYLFSHAILPQLSDGAALGSAALMWSDAFMADGAVINFANGNATVTHATGSLAVNVPWRVPSYTVAGLPAGSAGDIAYASNGRKNGEGVGAGTGVLVFKDASAWRACDTGATVAA